jgi:hypothetical protein
MTKDQAKNRLLAIIMQGLFTQPVIINDKEWGHIISSVDSTLGYELFPNKGDLVNALRELANEIERQEED